MYWPVCMEGDRVLKFDHGMAKLLALFHSPCWLVARLCTFLQCITSILCLQRAVSICAILVDFVFVLWAVSCFFFFLCLSALSLSIANFILMASFIFYSTVRDAVLTYARKPTRFSLICRMETTTKKCKTEKLKSKRGCVSKSQ